MKKWIKTSEELPPLYQKVEIKITNTAVYSDIFDSSSDIIPQCKCKEEETAYLEPFGDRSYWQMSSWGINLPQVSHWLKEIIIPIESRFEILDL